MQKYNHQEKNHLWFRKKPLIIASGILAGIIFASVLLNSTLEVGTVFDVPFVANIDSSPKISEIQTVVYPWYENVNSRIEYLVTVGKEYAEAGDYSEAIAYFDKAIWEGIQEGIANPVPLIEKGSVMHKMGKYSEALVYFDNALDIDPENPIALKKKASALAQLGDLEKAKYYFEASLRPKM